MDEYYRILELSRGATITEIKKAYRTLARKYHPDINPSQEANLRFQQIADAYEKLLENHQSTFTQTYAQTSAQYQARFQQVYQNPPPTQAYQTFSNTTSKPPHHEEVEDSSFSHRVAYFLLDLLSWSVSLFFVALPFFAGYLMVEKGFGWWEGAIMTPLSFAGMLVIWRTIRFRRNAF